MADTTTHATRGSLATVLPGVAMIAVTFGLARYGYGLLLPAMRADLALDPRAGGLIASGAYVSYLVTNTAVVWLTGRFGPRAPLAGAAASAAGGMTVLALAEGPATVAVGVLLAGASSGLAFPPYADVVAATLPQARRATASSAIGSGTGWGVALAGPLAILLGTQWRAVWLAFAAIAVVVGIVAVRAAPRRAGATGTPPRPDRSWLRRPGARPLLVSTVLAGAGTAVWWSFAVDALRAAGTADEPARTAYAVCGAASVAASATGAVAARFGARRCYLACGLVLAAAIAAWSVAGTSVALAIAAGAAFGATYGAVIIVQVLWSMAIAAERPSAGVAAVNTALTVGTITGPAIAGSVIDRSGHPVAMLGAAGAVAAAMLLGPRRAPGA